MEITGVRHDVNREAASEFIRYTRLNKFPGSLFLEDNNNLKLDDIIYFSRVLRKTITNTVLFIFRLFGVQTNGSLLYQNSISICEFSEE